MNGVEQTLEVAKGISEYGIMAIMCASFLLLTSGMIVTGFQWFRQVIEKMMGNMCKDLEKQNESWKELMNVTSKIEESYNDIAEGLRTETQLRIRNLTGFAFDLAADEVCALIKKIRKENHIADKEATHEKVRKSLVVMHEDRKSRFDAFTFRGKRLSEFCNDEWVDKVAKVVEKELYDEENEGRARTNVKLAYDDIKTDFYHKLNN